MTALFPKGNRNRGLTLLETLLASAILAMMASVCAPTLSAALRAVGDRQSRSDADVDVRFELSEFAEQFLDDPTKFNCKDLPRTIRQSPLTLTWAPKLAAAGDTNRPVVTREIIVQALPTAAERPDHLWLAFTHNRQVVVRYLALPEEAKQP